jgi:hypothetical protein
MMDRPFFFRYINNLAGSAYSARTAAPGAPRFASSPIFAVNIQPRLVSTFFPIEECLLAEHCGIRLNACA